MCYNSYSYVLQPSAALPEGERRKRKRPLFPTALMPMCLKGHLPRKNALSCIALE